MTDDKSMTTNAAVAWLKTNKGKSLTAIKTQLVVTNIANNRVSIKGLDKKTNQMTIGQFQAAYKAQAWTEKPAMVNAND